MRHSGLESLQSALMYWYKVLSFAQARNQDESSWPAFSGRYSGLAVVIPRLLSSDLPIRKILGSVLPCYFLLSLFGSKSHSIKLLSTLRFSLDAVPEGVDIQQVKSAFVLSWTMWLVSISLWTAERRLEYVNHM